MNLAKAAEYATTIYKGVTVMMAVVDMGTSLTEIITSGVVLGQKVALQNLWKKHEKEFSLMVEAGELVEKLEGITSLGGEIKKAQISSTENWSTIALELDRNTEIIQKMGPVMS